MEPRQIAVEEHGLFVAFQFFAYGWGNVGHAVAHVFQILKITEQLFRRLFAYALHSGHVVGRIADEGLHVRPLGRFKPRFPAEGFQSDDLFLAGGGVPHDHSGSETLTQVLVHADDDDGAFPGVSGGKARNAVVRFASLGNHHLHAQRAHHVLQGLYLRDKPLRRRGTVGLVGRKYLMSEMPAVPVHDKDEVFGPLLSEKLEQHPAHDVQRARGEAVGTRHSGIGEISPEQKGVAVHHIKGGPV